MAAGLARHGPGRLPSPPPPRPRRGDVRRPGPPAVPTRLLFINQYYWPDHASTAQHLTDLAEGLAAEGNECHVVCSQGGYRPGSERPPRHEVHNGVHIHRVPATALGRRSTLTRMADYLSFYARALALALALPRFDVVTTLTTPPIIGLIGTLLRRLKGSKHVYWSMDLHPDASLALGRMSPRHPVVAWLKRLSDLVYRQADAVVVLGPYMADRIVAKGARADRVVTIPVWSRRDEVYPLPRLGHPLRESLGVSDRFVAMYSGNLGLAHCFDEFLEAARRLRDRPDIVFLFVGNGPRLAEVRDAQRARRLDEHPAARLLPARAAACLALDGRRPPDLDATRDDRRGRPRKLYGAMASGRPALFVGPEHCESADAIRQADCGLTVRLGDVDGLVDALTRLAADPDLALEMGERGRAGFLAAYEREGCCSRWSRLFADLDFSGKTSAATTGRRPVVSTMAIGSHP